MTNPVLVIGVGGDGPAGLTPELRKRIARAELLIGGERLLAHWPDHPAEKVAIKANVPALIERLRRRGEARTVVLASGDPGFYGIAETLLRHLPPEELEIVPHVGALQLAFARAGIGWSDAILTSAHARPLAEVVGWARRAPRIGILTGREHTPSAIAETLLEAGIDDCRAIVAENLGRPDERIVDTRLAALPGSSFAPLNVLLLIRDADWRPQPIIAPRPDEAYAHRGGLITKADVRALSLTRLALSETDTAWDVGAGSGAVSIEMAQIAWRGRVFAVEKDAENLGYIRENVVRFGALNVAVVEGRAPAALEGLPRPSAVFVGGTGGALEPILSHIDSAARRGCRVVMNLATLENLHQAMDVMDALGWTPQVSQVNVAHGRAIAGRTRLAPLNPVFILKGEVTE
jgi:precorrin-6Y C5,15-methyltransferase (decarboxylating)